MVLLRSRVRTEDWRPIGVEVLEGKALDVVHSTDNRYVIAGPGAGKTELLAQRAAYLLQTGAASAPQRILAISFKRDAATNLATRVRQRCHPNHAGRFDSMTFDAFAKGLVDRFGQGLPKRWRPRPEYEILLTNPRFYRNFLNEIGEPPSAVGTLADIMALEEDKFEKTHLIGQPLPVDGWPTPTPAEWAADQFWQSFLHKRRNTHLSFPMIGRLAELLLRLNPLVRDALRLTYSHLFMDEFQDTTPVQYDLVKIIFLGSNTVITSVGDTKQQIMRWANAMPDPFGAVETDFHAKRTSLIYNYRSSQELVRIQHIIAQTLDADAIKPVSKIMETIDGDSCSIWDFSSPEIEAEELADYVAEKMEIHNLSQRDFVLIVRQKPADYAKILTPAFANKGLLLRNEAASVDSVTLQDLLTEEVSEIVVRILRLATSDKAGAYWSECQRALSSLRGMDATDEAAQTRLSRELDGFAREFREAYPDPVGSQADTQAVVAKVLDFVGRDRLITAHPAYRQGDWFKKVIKAATSHLWDSAANAADWTETLDAYEGKHVVPLMTIHKSKGLEYHTVIFVGLDDAAWWSFTDDPAEGKAGFFVAFSRAKQRVIFTYCAYRGDRKNIAPLYKILQSAGIRSISVGLDS